jgi:hypothetical protein
MPVPRLVLCPRWHTVFSVRRTLVSGATYADVNVWWLTLIHVLLKEAMDAVVLKRRTRLLQLHVLGAYWTTSVKRWTRCLRSNGHVCWLESIVGNLTTRDMWHASERWTLDAMSVAVATDASGAPEKRPVKGQRLYSFVGL